MNPETVDERMMAETPEDVAVLYSWANLQGAKYRDFSASRREYRAQMRHRQAEQLREEELKGKVEAETAASEAERAAREAEEAARFHEAEARKASTERHVEQYREEEDAKARAQRHAVELNRMAAAERVEAARRAEAVAAAEAAARREEREMAEAQASAARQAARYQESEYRRQSLAGPQPDAFVPGEISDPYTNDEPAVLPGRLFHQPQVHEDDMQPIRMPRSREARLLIPQPDPRDPHHAQDVKEYWVTGTMDEEARIAAGGSAAIEKEIAKPKSHISYYYDPNPQERVEAVEHYAQSAPYTGRDRLAERQQEEKQLERSRDARGAEAAPVRAGVFDEQPRGTSIYGLNVQPRVAADSSAAHSVSPIGVSQGAPMYDPIPGSPRPESSIVRAAAARRSGVYDVSKLAEPALRAATAGQREAAPRDSRPRKTRGYRPDEASGVQPSYNGNAFGHNSPAAEPASVPAWITSSEVIPVARPSRLEPVRVAETARIERQPEPIRIPEPVRQLEPQRMVETPMAAETLRPLETPRALEQPRPVEQPRVSEDVRSSSVIRRTPLQQQSAVIDTLQHSRERVAARWYALKGVFDHHQHDQQPEPVRNTQKDVRVPMLTVFSLAGGVGKTSLVATIGRALSSTGEKVLLTDTTSHGLLPFYFGASELRPGSVRTFSPPPGSSDAAIALVSYDVAQNNGDAAQQEWLSDELTQKGRGMQRVVLDLSPISPWVVRRLAKMGSVVVIPVAPDMNSVISLGPVEKFFAGMIDADGRTVQPYYLLNQFDASLPLHLDVREVMRQQLGDRLLPFVIRRSPVVSEALAEGMTVIDYAPDSPVAGDYMNFAQWLRMQSAPAASGMKNARWSER